MTEVGQYVAGLVKGEMKIGSDDLDADRISRKAEVAIELITAYLDPPVKWVDDHTEWPATVLDAAVTVARELYQRKDAPFGIVGAWGEDGSAARISSDPLAGVKAMLGPHKQRGWGIA